MPLNGGEEERILDQPPANWAGWGLTRNGIYFLNLNEYGQVRDTPNAKIEFFDFATRTTSSILDLAKPVPPIAGLAVSPDGRSLLYEQNEFRDSYIMLVRNFH